MGRIKDFDKLLELEKNFSKKLEIRNNPNKVKVQEKHILICGGTGCKASTSDVIKKALEKEIKLRGLQDKVKVIMTGCFGFCAQGPIINIMPDNTFYIKVNEEDVSEIIDEHIIKNKVIDRLLYSDLKTNKKIQKKEDIPFYKKQSRIALRNCGIIDSESIEEAIGSGSYTALGKVLTSKTKEEVVEIVKESGLRGRGGGGFPTGRKWEAAAKYSDPVKYVICNADEGDPGAFMDRAILEGDPHSVLEAMAICGYAIGSNQGYIYIRAEYPLAVNRLKIAISEAREKGLLGASILGTSFSFDIEIRYGAGAFVCGEATALIHSIEGLRGEPTMKPPRTAEHGLWDKPTCVNNVETFANINPIINKGANWYSSIGTHKSTGTKVFALAGKIENVGLVEVPMGISLREIIEDIGGGVKDGKALKAVQTGGPSGGCIPKELIDISIEYDSLKSIGSMMGSGGMIVMDEDNCMVDISKYYMEFTVDESCGKCTPCRIGNKRVLEILEKITLGQGTEEDLVKLKELSEVIKSTSLCGLGESATNPVLSSLRYFGDEYLEHVVEKKCRSRACRKLVVYEISDKCIGCTKCARACPVSCIHGKVKSKHEIDKSKCIKCGACYSVCPIKAVVSK
ncbi:4Fe-4S binding protein [Clostridium sp. SHJSY1]|uniref:NADH-ubiquinone oxidoreductase-F iron-sulfur binding region domain-containing protein n=1 Tax=Clostridium sp. SHJSY1 TaxID=2942483 RepID=UPI002875D4AC|nr:NADH-ubiquinone oxidoreductase-F iron-sulfur binding region domain-containing protein [Clostridium sp. SHJSY1]MDS0525220.1 4Fe-4S binding protein [Clostridium sp. SHJSY1]